MGFAARALGPVARVWLGLLLLPLAIPRLYGATMKDGFLVLDADRHSMDPSTFWGPYLEPQYRGRGHCRGGCAVGGWQAVLPNARARAPQRFPRLEQHATLPGSLPGGIGRKALVRLQTCGTWTGRAWMLRCCSPAMG